MKPRPTKIPLYYRTYIEVPGWQNAKWTYPRVFYEFHTHQGYAGEEDAGILIPEEFYGEMWQFESYVISDKDVWCSILLEGCFELKKCIQIQTKIEASTPGKTVYITREYEHPIYSIKEKSYLSGQKRMPISKFLYDRWLALGGCDLVASTEQEFLSQVLS